MKKGSRAARRAQEKLLRDLERLARLGPGGSPERALVVDSPAVVDLRAVAEPCPLCDGRLRLEEHTAVTVDEVRLRAAAVACTLCGTRRTLYFRLREPQVH